VYRLTVPWAEGNGTGVLPANRGTGSGATWQCAVDTDIGNVRKDCSGATAWRMLLPDAPHPWATQASASTTITDGETGTVSFDVTADVSAFLSGTANDGWIVMRGNVIPVGSVTFGSRESGAQPTLVLNVDNDQAPTQDLTQPYADPTLTSGQEQAATAAVQADPSFNALVGSASYTIADVSAWGLDDHPGLVGAVVDVHFDTPQTIDGSWPEFTWNGDSSTSSYTTTSYDLELWNVTDIDAYVDLTTDAVVGLDYNPDALLSDPNATNGSEQHGPERAGSAQRASSASDVPGLVEDDTDVETGRATNDLQIVCPDGVNCFYNFDFSTKAKDENVAAWNLVDWPVDMLWTGDANIDLVKSYIHDDFGWGWSGSAMAASIDVGSTRGGNTLGWTWDTDKGIKEVPCTYTAKTPHTRLYAPSDTDQLYSPTYGYYILGTMHFDWGECIGKPASVLGLGHYGGAGYSETVESLITTLAQENPDYSGWEVVTEPNSVPLFNAEHSFKGDHIAQNNGLATEISLEPVF